MPDRELRRMRRAELVEIILALKQTEDRLRAENAALSAQLQERQIHIENAGSIAQAQTEAANLKARTQKECDEQAEAAARSRAQTEADCKAMLARTQQEIRQRWAAFDRRASELLDGYHSTEFLPEERADK